LVEPTSWKSKTKTKKGKKKKKRGTERKIYRKKGTSQAREKNKT
jgi:ribosomal protein L19E